MYEENDIVICKKCKSELEKLNENKLIEKEKLKLLKNPKRIIEANFPIKKDNSEIEIIHAFRVLYSNNLGPGKGGIRYHQDVDMDEVSELAFTMALKTSLTGLDFGGAKGGVKINPKNYSKNELEKISRGFVKEFYEFLGPQKDVPAPDVNTNPEIMGWMRDEFENISGENSPAFITGKTIENGGSLGRDKSTAMGAFYIIQEKYKNIENKSKISVAVQGYGNAGTTIASLLNSAGYKIVAISDSSTGILDKDGLKIEEIFQKIYVGEKKERLSSLKNFEKISNEELLELEVDILIPAALGGVINNSNVDKIKAKEILELANGPISVEAEEILLEKNILIIPDLLANAGGVIVSVFEWEQNLKNENWSLEEVNQKLKDKILTAYEKVRKLSEEKNIDWRLAAHKIAIERIVEK